MSITTNLNRVSAGIKLLKKVNLTFINKNVLSTAELTHEIFRSNFKLCTTKFWAIFLIH